LHVAGRARGDAQEQAGLANGTRDALTHDTKPERSDDALPPTEAIACL
jgi:hypothetical protein